MKAKKTKHASGRNLLITERDISMSGHHRDTRTDEEFVADALADFPAGEPDEVLWDGSRVVAVIRTSPNGEPQAIRFT